MSSLFKLKFYIVLMVQYNDLVGKKDSSLHLIMFRMTKVYSLREETASLHFPFDFAQGKRLVRNDGVFIITIS